jgi:hypothetical protein
VWERGKQVREVSENSGRSDQIMKTLRKKYIFITYDYFLLQVHAVQENSTRVVFQLLKAYFLRFPLGVNGFSNFY